MSDPAVDIGRRLKAARARAQVSQTELATHLGVTQTAVSYWEAGRRLPGIDQLMKAAAFLDAPIADLLPETSSRQPVMAVLRAVAEQVNSEELAQSLERFAEAASALPVPPVELQTRAAGARDAAEQLLATGGVNRFPVEVDTLAERCGVRVLPFDFGGMVDGLVVQLPDGPAIGLDVSKDNEGRRRFTLAHELGHHLLRHSASFHVDFRDAGVSAGDSPGYNWQHERAANEFAANLLMPADLVREAFRHDEDVHRLATAFAVSRAAMGFRLAALGLRTGPLE
jgi:Zn-dependent peptidase ImmA (M78 family)/DNA-binding XRE family transcriptional regulator